MTVWISLFHQNYFIFAYHTYIYFQNIGFSAEVISRDSFYQQVPGQYGKYQYAGPFTFSIVPHQAELSLNGN